MNAPPESPPVGLVKKDFYNAAYIPLEDTKAPESTLARGLQVCKAAGAEAFVSMGTALGFVREGDFIPDDSDVDVGVLGDWNVFTHLKRLERAIPQLLGFDLLRSLVYEGRPMQFAFRDPDNSCIFDIYFYYLNYEPGMVVNVNAYGFMRYPVKLFEKPLTKIKTKHGVWPALFEVEAYLEYHYGADWKEKRPGYKGLYWKGTPR